MTARQSAEVKEALALVRGGMSAYKAARATGIHQSTLSRNKEYQAIMDSRRKETGVK